MQLAQLCDEIERAYADLGHQLGWRFLTSPQHTLSASTKIALITLNPGGSIDRPDHPRASSEAGSAYLVETWRNGLAPGAAPLQRQVQQLFAMLAEASHGVSGNELLGSSLSAYFIPFRSPSIKALAKPRESEQFASGL